MKKLIAILTLSTFTLGAFAASSNRIMQKDTGKKTKRDTAKKDTAKKPKPAAHR